MAPKTEVIEQLRARIAELEEENARLKRTNSSYANLTKAQESQLTNIRQRLYQLKGADSAIDSERQANCDLTEQLAAEQLNNKLLREALEAVIKVHGYESGIPVEALSTPASTEALDKYVAEKVKDVQLQDIEQYRLQMAGISTASIGYWKEDDSIHPDYDTPALRDVAKLYANYESRTKQRDLAVEALEWALSNINCEPFEWSDEENADAHKAAIESLSAIKESEA